MLPVTIASISPKPRILLVEDESGIADTLQYVLDLGLPDPNGFERFRRLQAQPGHGSPPWADTGHINVERAQ
jgi:DNA-binding response OmpR family regulator